jgi:hypothetical protein
MKYPATLAGAQVQQELEVLKLKKTTSCTPSLEVVEGVRTEAGHQYGGVAGVCDEVVEFYGKAGLSTSTHPSCGEVFSESCGPSKEEEVSGQQKGHEAVCNVHRKGYGEKEAISNVFYEKSGNCAANVNKVDVIVR